MTLLRLIRSWLHRRRVLAQQRMFALGFSWAMERLVVIARMPPEQRHKELLTFRAYCDELTYLKPDRFDEGVDRAFAAYIANTR